MQNNCRKISQWFNKEIAWRESKGLSMGHDGPTSGLCCALPSLVPEPKSAVSHLPATHLKEHPPVRVSAGLHHQHLGRAGVQIHRHLW